MIEFLIFKRIYIILFQILVYIWLILKINWRCCCNIGKYSVSSKSYSHLVLLTLLVRHLIFEDIFFNLKLLQHFILLSVDNRFHFLLLSYFAIVINVYQIVVFFLIDFFSYRVIIHHRWIFILSLTVIKFIKLKIVINRNDLLRLPKIVCKPCNRLWE